MAGSVYIRAFSTLPEKSEKKEFYFAKEPISIERYQKGFSVVYDAIQRGDTFLLNLTYPTNLKTNLTLKEVDEATALDVLSSENVIMTKEATFFSPGSRPRSSSTTSMPFLARAWAQAAPAGPAPTTMQLTLSILASQ